MSGNGRKKTHGQSIPFKTFSLLKRMVWFQHFKARVLSKFGRKIGWVTSGFPVELILTFDIVPLYPENHSAICAARHLGGKLKLAAMKAGLASELCSYGLIDIGSIETGISPIGGLAKPDLLFCCNNICSTVLKWYQLLTEYFRVPLLFIDTPFLCDEIAYDQPPPDYFVDYVQSQLEIMIKNLEKITGIKFNERKFQRIIKRSKQAVALWTEILETTRQKPSPMTSFDAFVHMAPIVTMRGTKGAVKYYQKLLNELKYRIKNKIAAIPGESKRIVWDNIPIWTRMRDMSRFFMERKIAIVADTYTGAWAEHSLPEDGNLRDFARIYASTFLNRGLKSRAFRLEQLVKKYDADAFVVHSNRSCKPYSLGQYEIVKIVKAKTGKPGIIIEADHADPDAFDEKVVFKLLNDFFNN